MPVKNGIQAAKELKTLMPDVPIFLFTMHAQAVEHGAENYIDVVVPKSQPNVLLNHVKAFLLNETRVRPRAI
jgi:DNA-binding NarL/FixJ family response regulator